METIKNNIGYNYVLVYSAFISKFLENIKGTFWFPKEDYRHVLVRKNVVFFMTKTLLNFVKQEFRTGQTENTRQLRVISALQSLKRGFFLKFTNVKNFYIKDKYSFEFQKIVGEYLGEYVTVETLKEGMAYIDSNSERQFMVLVTQDKKLQTSPKTI